MKKIFIICFYPLCLLSQEINIEETNKHIINWESNFLFESNNLNKDFFNTMLYGGYITNDMKKKWIDLGSEKNIIYSEISNKISYSYNVKDKTIELAIADRNILNANFTDDLLRLAFEGNFHYQDKILDFSKTNIRADRFQQYQLNYSTKIQKINIKSSISYLAGNHHISYIIKEGSIYTAPAGTSLDISYNIDAFLTDTSSKINVFANNGKGAAIGITTNFQIKDYNIQLSMIDLGYIIWNNSSITVKSDTTFTQQGIEIEDIFNFNDSILEDYIIELNNKTNNTSFKSYIPATINLCVSGKTNKKILENYEIGIIARWQPYKDDMPLSFKKIEQGFQQSNYSPLLYIQSTYLTKNIELLPKISYGGYSNDINLGFAISTGKKRKLVIGTEHIEDLTNGNNAKAVSLYFNMIIQI